MPEAGLRRPNHLDGRTMRFGETAPEESHLDLFFVLGVCLCALGHLDNDKLNHQDQKSRRWTDSPVEHHTCQSSETHM